MNGTFYDPTECKRVKNRWCDPMLVSIVLHQRKTLLRPTKMAVIFYMSTSHQGKLRAHICRARLDLTDVDEVEPQHVVLFKTQLTKKTRSMEQDAQ